MLIKKEGKKKRQKTKFTTTSCSKGIREKYLSCHSRKLLGTILKGDQKRIPINGPENKKTNDDA